MKIVSFRTAALIAFIGCLLKVIISFFNLIVSLPSLLPQITDMSDRLFLLLTLYENKLED